MTIDHIYQPLLIRTEHGQELASGLSPLGSISSNGSNVSASCSAVAITWRLSEWHPVRRLSAPFVGRRADTREQLFGDLLLPVWVIGTPPAVTSPTKVSASS